MKNLFFGGSSEIAIKIAKKIKNTNNISRSKSKVYLKNYLIKNYNSDNIKKVLKIINNKFDNIVIFNGAFSGSFLTNYEEKEFNRIFTLNFKIPMLIAQLSLKQKIINKNGAIFFISSLLSQCNSFPPVYRPLRRVLHRQGGPEPPAHHPDRMHRDLRRGLRRLLPGARGGGFNVGRYSVS